MPPSPTEYVGLDAVQWGLLGTFGGLLASVYAAIAARQSARTARELSDLVQGRISLQHVLIQLPRIEQLATEFGSAVRAGRPNPVRSALHDWLRLAGEMLGLLDLSQPTLEARAVGLEESLQTSIFLARDAVLLLDDDGADVGTCTREFRQELSAIRAQVGQLTAIIVGQVPVGGSG